MNTIGILMDRTEGALQRIIGLIERRGFVVAGVTMRAGTDAVAYVAMDLRARDDTRSLDVLIRQIARLVDVQRVAAGSHGRLLDPAATPAACEPASAGPSHSTANNSSVCAEVSP